MSIWTCEACSTSFTRPGRRPYRFCSPACRTTGLRPSRPDHPALRRLYIEEHLTTPEIAKRYGCDPKTAWSWLRAAGIQTRSRGAESSRGTFVPGQPSAFAGMTHTPEVRELIRQQRMSDGRVPFLVNGEHYAKGRAPEQHPNWKGGVTPERQAFYASDEWRQVSRGVWVRDGCRCQRCGTRPPSKGPKHQRGHVHHIASFAAAPQLRADPANLVLLCADCHRWVHSRANTEQELIA